MLGLPTLTGAAFPPCGGLLAMDIPVTLWSHVLTGVDAMNQPATGRRRELTHHRRSPLINLTDFGTQASTIIAGGLNAILADGFALYMKTKIFQWLMSGPHFRDYHVLLDEQADQLCAMTALVVERNLKYGGSTLRPLGQIARLQRITYNDPKHVDPLDALSELRDDNLTLTAHLIDVRNLVDELRDFGTASVVEVWINETEQRAWFLFESSRQVD
jgi:starvation-inducible DNA-binding protein